MGIDVVLHYISKPLEPVLAANQMTIQTQFSDFIAHDKSARTESRVT